MSEPTNWAELVASMPAETQERIRSLTDTVAAGVEAGQPIAGPFLEMLKLAVAHRVTQTVVSRRAPSPEGGPR